MDAEVMYFIETKKAPYNLNFKGNRKYSIQYINWLEKKVFELNKELQAKQINNIQEEKCG